MVVSMKLGHEIKKIQFLPARLVTTTVSKLLMINRSRVEMPACCWSVHLNLYVMVDIVKGGGCTQCTPTITRKFFHP
jgi:hypothetical protein